MCQACWIMATRRSGGGWNPAPAEDGAAPPSRRFAAVAEWADEASDGGPADEDVASDAQASSVDAGRS